MLNSQIVLHLYTYVDNEAVPRPRFYSNCQMQFNFLLHIILLLVQRSLFFPWLIWLVLFLFQGLQ